MAGGRTGKISSKVDDWLTPEKLVLIQAWSREGCTNGMLCFRMGIAEKTLWEWRKKYPQLDQAMRKGREVVDYEVENALLKSALGYVVEEIEEVTDIRGKVIKRKVTKKHVQPNVTAQLAWLNNRCPDKWKRNRDNDISDEKQDHNLTVRVVKHGDKYPDDEELTEVETEADASDMLETSDGDKVYDSWLGEEATNNKEADSKRIVTPNVDYAAEEDEWSEEADDGSWPEDFIDEDEWEDE